MNNYLPLFFRYLCLFVVFLGVCIFTQGQNTSSGYAISNSKASILPTPEQIKKRDILKQEMGHFNNTIEQTEKNIPFDTEGYNNKSNKATYLHPTVGLQSQNNGACMVNIDCSTTHSYYDNGGGGSNYALDINQVYRTFCPNTAGRCIRAQVVSMDIEGGSGSCYDHLWVINGATQNNAFLWDGCGTNASPVTLSGNYSGGTWTSTDQSGCLGFRFLSDNSTTRPGWNITLSCVNCAQAQQSSNNDCNTAEAICDVTNFSGSSPGPGLAGICSGCNISENYSNWYYFEITNDGNMGITITPDDLNDDYDFALYNGGACGSIGAPVRCTWAMGTGATGMGNGASDPTEDVYGDSWVSTLDVTAGDAYYLLINNWTPSGTGFEISFQWSGGAGADCSIVPVEMLDFSGTCDDGKTTLQWVTASELNNDYFTVMKSGNGMIFKTIGWVMGAGTSNELRQYQFTDEELNDKPVYYQLKQTDFDGSVSFSKMIQVNCGHVMDVFECTSYQTDENTLVADFTSVVGENYVVSIIDITGKQISTKSVTADANSTIIEFPISLFYHGLFILKITSQNIQFSEKIVIQ